MYYSKKKKLGLGKFSFYVFFIVISFVFLGSSPAKAATTFNITATPSPVTKGNTTVVNVSMATDLTINGKSIYIFISDDRNNDILKNECQSAYSCSYSWNTGENDSSLGTHRITVALRKSRPAGSDWPASSSDDQSGLANVDVVAVGSNTGTTVTTPAANTFVGGTDINALQIPSVHEFLKLIAFNWFPVIIGAAGFFGILIAGFTIVMAGGDAEKAKKGRLAIVYIATGMILGTLAWVIVSVVVKEIKTI